jgi:fructose-1,6-bisphosphatase I
MSSTLQDYLEGWAAGDPRRVDVAATLSDIAGATARLLRDHRPGPLAGSLDAVVGSNADGDAQKDLDVRADAMFLDAMRGAPVAVYASEENPEPVALRPDASLAVALDPLDGSSNIETNVSVGTFFSILPVSAGRPRTRPSRSPVQPSSPPASSSTGRRRPSCSRSGRAPTSSRWTDGPAATC